MFSTFCSTNLNGFLHLSDFPCPQDWPRLSSLGPLELRRLVDLQRLSGDGGLRQLVRKTLGRRCPGLWGGKKRGKNGKKNNGYSKLWVTIENLRGFKMIEVGFYFCNNMVIIGYPGFGDPTLNHGWDVMCG